MSESKIPSISSKKRPFSSGDECSSGLPTLKRKSVLMNITNTVGTNGSTSMKDSNMKLSFCSPFQTKSQSTNMRLLNKYFYGDPNVIEEVKRRERKVLTDINYLKKELQNVQDESHKLNEKIIPALKYELNKKSQIFRTLRQETLSLQENLYTLNNSCDNERQKNELVAGNLGLKHSLNLQDKTNHWEKVISDKKQYWESELLKIRQKGPDSLVLQELHDLKLEKDEKVTKIENLMEQNRMASDSFDNELREKFVEFKKLKEAPLEQLNVKSEALNAELLELNLKEEEIQATINEYRNEGEILAKKIEEIEIKIKENQACTNPTEVDLHNLQKAYADEKAQTDRVKIQATAAEREYHRHYEKMEQEQIQRSILENTIDELTGVLRCYAYVDEENFEGEGIQVDFASRSIVVGNESHYFNRVLPKSLLCPQDLFSKECFLFVESCLKHDKNCTIISMNGDLRIHFLNMVQTKFNDCRVDVQMVVLSDNDTSKDILNPDDFDLSAVIDEECIDFHSRKLPIDEASKYVLEDYKGVHVMKFEVYLNSGDSYHSIFFIQPSVEEIQKFEPASFKKKSDSPISTFLHSLFLRIQSLIIFQFKTADLSLLALSQNLRRLPNPK